MLIGGMLVAYFEKDSKVWVKYSKKMLLTSSSAVLFSSGVSSVIHMAQAGIDALAWFLTNLSRNASSVFLLASVSLTYIPVMVECRQL